MRAQRPSFVWLTAFGAACLLGVRADDAPKAPAPAAAQAKIAEVQSFSGTVSIQPKTGDARTPKMIAKRVRDGSMYNHDTLSTQSGGSVEILFLDSTKVKLEEKTSIVVEESKLAKPTDKGHTLGRRIKILAGKVVSTIQPSKEVVTEFETPAGVAAVRGTVLSAENTTGNGFVEGNTPCGQFGCDDGRVAIRDAGNLLHAMITADQDVILGYDAQRGFSQIGVLEDGGSPVPVAIGDQILNLDEGAVLLIHPDVQDGGFDFESIRGGIHTERDGKVEDLEPGEKGSAGPAPIGTNAQDDPFGDAPARDGDSSALKSNAEDDPFGDAPARDGGSDEPSCADEVAAAEGDLIEPNRDAIQDRSDLTRDTSAPDSNSGSSDSGGGGSGGGGGGSP